MRFVLARHCQTNWNLEYRIQGHIDIILNDAGRSQAIDLGVKLRPFGITRIISSTLSRASETATLVAKNLNPESLSVPVHFDKRLRECCYGRLEGLTHKQVEVMHGKQWVIMDRTKRNFDFSSFGGENREEVKKRHLEFFNEVSYKYRWDTILLVGHGGSLSILLTALGFEPKIEQGNFMVIEV